MSEYHVSFPKLGWSFDIHSTAFSIGSFEVKWYGIIIGFGFLLAFAYGMVSCRKMKINAGKLLDAIILGLIFGIIGARLYYVLFFDGDKYIKDPIQKISMYQKIADIENNDEILDSIDELLDRYGDIPKETDNLLKIVEIRNMCRKLGINKVTTKGDFVLFEPLNLKLRLTNKASNDILINVQLELKKLESKKEEMG